MDGNSAPKKLVRPAASSKPNTPVVAADGNKNGSASPSVASITGEAIRKISMTTPISPINANRPGRLASFRGERDLTLGGARSGADAGAKPKKVFAPTIPARRTKAQDAGNEAKISDNVTSSRGRGRRDAAPRGRGRGKPELIQTTGSIFGEGVAGALKQRSSTSYADREDSGSSAGMEKPKLSALDTKIDKEQEDAALKELLRDDFLDHTDGDEFNPDLLLEPIQLPKCSFFAKKEEESPVKTEQPAVVTVDGVTIKQEKEEAKPKVYQRRVNPSEVSVKDIFECDGELVFFQLPDVLPSLKADKERPVVKLEPGTTSQKSDESAATSSAAEKSQSENVFEDTPEGRLGTLRIHQSGKVTLQMGNHSFVIDSATQVPFLQDLVSVEVDTQEKKGTMKDLGPIKYKAVCLPDWDDLIKEV